uniref:DNA polymerase alpha subunit B isoform X2 n=1 Tax=Doryrhamphus excisus TaxID=161450 RepID=UPI0025AE3E1B|nr:DNA polymerase alpha subunit B isoform X2 [Doryrhamphus excisus]
MSRVTAEDVKLELDMFGIACNDDSALDKIVEQCICSRIPADEWVLEWVAYSTTKNGVLLSVDTLDQFEHDVLNKRNKLKQSLKRDERSRLRDVHTIQDIIKAEEEEDHLLDSYSTPAKASQKRALTTPENPQSKRSSALTSPGVLLSPSCFSPSTTPSHKYSRRGGKGEVVVSFGAAQGARWTGSKAAGADIQLDLLEDSLRCGYKYMFQRLRDVRNVLTEKMEDLGDVLRRHYNIEEFSPVSLPAQDAVCVVGQVCCDSNGKLNAQSLLLEAGPEHGAQQVRLDLSELQEYSLFPGQVVVLEGMNTTGGKLVVSKVYQGLPLPFFSSEVKVEMDEEPVSVLVACGPYTPSDSLNFDPLLDLLHVIARDGPDVCILLGPFVDSKHDDIEKSQVTETFDAIFSRCIESIVEGTKGVGCRLVFVPSQRDVHHHYVYPQPPFTLPSLCKNPRVTLAPDPCTLLIGGVTFGLTSTDILFHMGAEEISSGGGSDRFSRILKHMLTQRSYYPLYPPVEEVNMDYERFQSFGQMALTPDVLIVPSELRYFVKEVMGCVCVNPGRLTKGHVGGTYSRLMIGHTASSDQDKERVSPCLAAQVVKV